MTIQPGARLGHYTVLSAIGRGGMGEVWKARDATLGRDVAIKTLPDGFARDEERVLRFTREARLLATLNHPNIAAIYGLETSDGTPFLVLELVNGDTLADRLSRRVAGVSAPDGSPRRAPIPVDESLQLALQLADALGAAHESGVIHRDLKPANIKVTGGERVKVLDFGLAKTFAPDAAVVPADSPTVSIHATRPGVILGTAGYMSPEQIKGDAVDKRADIWAFGCVLYEMLAGCQAFGGADATTMMARVVDREPDFSLLPANLHPRLRDLLRRCLSKDVKRRYQDIGDVRMDLEAILAGPSGPSVEPVPVPAIGTRSRLPWAVGILAAAVVAGAAAWVLKPMPPIQVHRSQHQLPEGAEFRNRSANVIAVAPGGQFYVYNATGGLYVKKAEDLHAQLIRGTDDVTNPFISPDGRWVGYWHRGRRTIERIAVSGGAPIAIVTATFEPSGISWAPDNTILWAYQNAIFRISLDSENPRQIVDVPQKVLSGPTLLPDGRGVMFTQTDKGWDAGDIVVALLDEKKTQRVVLKGRAARYLPTGHLVYAVGDELLAVRFDLGTLKPISTPVQVASKVLGAGTSDSANYAVTDQGSLVYAAGGPAGGVGDALSLVWVNRDGTETAIDLELAGYSSPRLSPDGTRVAAQVSASTSSYDVWVADLTRQPPTLFKLSHRALDAFPAWALDSQSIVFSSDRDYQKGGARSFFRLRADGTGEPEHLIKITTSARWWAHSFSPNGRLLAFTYDDPKTRGNIGLISLEGVPTARPLIETSAEEHQPVIAPRSGNWIAYASDLNGTQEVYVERFPTLGDRVPISTGGGSSPLWSGDESELFYVRPDGAVMVVPIQHGSKLTPGNAGVLIPAGPYKTIRSTVVNYDYDSRRRRFLMVRSATNTDPQARPRIVTVLSWITEVSERLQAQ